MAAAYIKIYCNGYLVRKYGGNKRAVKNMMSIYQKMDSCTFRNYHERFIRKYNLEKSDLCVAVQYYRN